MLGFQLAWVRCPLSIIIIILRYSTYKLSAVTSHCVTQYIQTVRVWCLIRTGVRLALGSHPASNSTCAS